MVCYKTSTQWCLVSPPSESIVSIASIFTKTLKERLEKLSGLFSSEMLVERLATLDSAACRELRQMGRPRDGERVLILSSALATKK